MSAKEMLFKARVNGELVEVHINPGENLLEVLRERLELTGSKEGCGEGVCGACTVLVDGTPRRACLTLALEAEGCEVLTVEGLAPGKKVSPLQKAFVLEGAIQCGFCAPGMLIASHELLQREPNPDTETIMNQLSGHICRCTGYAKIIQAVKSAADTQATEGCK
jgi:carbon-monoxide dehydrogenase small subunit